MTFLALIAIIFFGFAVYNLTCAFVDIPTKKTSQMMMLSRKQQGTKNEKLLDVYVTKIAGWIAPYLRLDRLKRNKVQRALDIAGLQLTPEVYTARAWVTAGAVGLCAIPMAFLIPLLVPILIGLAVALWFSTYYAAFDFVKKRRKLIEGEIPRFALTVGQSLENDRDVLKILTSYRRVAGKDFGAELDQTIADMKTGNYENSQQSHTIFMKTKSRRPIIRVSRFGLLHNIAANIYLIVLFCHTLRNFKFVSAPQNSTDITRFRHIRSQFSADLTNDAGNGCSAVFTILTPHFFIDLPGRKYPGWVVC